MTEESNNQNNAELKQDNLKTKKTKFYFFTKDKTFIWTIFSFIVVFFIVISFLNIKGLTTIHSYTFGMFFGMFSIAIYILLLLISTKKMFKMKNTYSIGVFHFSLWRVSLIIFSLILLGTSIYYTKNKPDLYSYKDAISKIMSKWYLDFKTGSTLPEDIILLPNKWTPGSIFSLIYIIFAFPGKTTGIVLSYIFPIILFCISFSMLFISDKKFNKLFYWKNKKKKTLNHQKNININLDKQENINKNSHLINEIIINNDEIPKSQENLLKDEKLYLSGLNKTSEQKILIEEPDFSTQEFETALQTEMRENNAFFNKESQEINVNYQMDKNFLKIDKEEKIEKNNIDYGEVDISFDENETDLKIVNEGEAKLTNEDNSIIFSVDNENDINKKYINNNIENKKMEDSKRFSIIEDKEKLF